MIAPKCTARSPSLLDSGLVAGAPGRALAMAECLRGRAEAPAPEKGHRRLPDGAPVPNAQGKAKLDR